MSVAWSPAEAHAPELSDEHDSSVSHAAAAVGTQSERTASRMLRDWAPTFLQHISREHTDRDLPTRVDFDGDWDATNNWDDLDALKTPTPAAYGAAILTSTHAYLTYALFYPRDWMSGMCVSYLCHDNDLEVALVVVERGHRGSPDRLAVVETKAHHSYDAMPGERVARDAAGHPVIEVESEGHGMYPVRAGQPVTGRGDDWITLGGTDASVSTKVDRTLKYELQSLHDTLWRQRSLSSAEGTLWSHGEGKELWYSGARQGRLGYAFGMAMAGRRYTGGVSPPWALHASFGERGDWFLDPAFVAVRRYPANWLSLDTTPSLTYELNPFVADLRSECEGGACPILVQPEPIPVTAWLGGGGILMLLAVRLTPGGRRSLVVRLLQKFRSGGSRAPKDETAHTPTSRM